MRSAILSLAFATYLLGVVTLKFSGALAAGRGGGAAALRDQTQTLWTPTR